MVADVCRALVIGAIWTIGLHHASTYRRRKSRPMGDVVRERREWCDRYVTR